MSLFVIRAILSGLIIALIAYVARKNPGFAALIASLPLISIIGMIWLWNDTKDAENMARHAEATFWYVLPSLPMFLLIPYLLRSGHAFWLSLTAGCLVTITLYVCMIKITSYFGLNL
jgi:uncharacterized membrane protein (GlpM family)